MGWQEDLASLLEETGGNVAGSAAGQTVGNVAGPVLGSGVAQAAFNFMDIPLSGVKYGTGALIGGINEGLGFLPGQPGYEPGTSAALHQGGPRAAWEQVRSEEPKWFQAPTEVLLDPTVYLGFGAGRNAATVAEASAKLAREAGRPFLATGLETAGTMARGSQFLWNDAGQAVLEGGRIPAAITRHGEDVFTVPRILAGRDVGIQPGVRKIAGGITKLRPTALQTAPRFVQRQEEDAIRHWVASQRSAGGITPAQQPISSLWDTAAPPQPVHPHPPGSAPDQAYQAGIKGWLRLHDPRLGIVPQARGESYWRDPSKVRLTEQHLQDMAAIGVSAMQAVTDEGGLMPSLMRATKGTQLMREGIVKQFGPGIEPFIPAVESRMRQQMLEQGLNPDTLMPASRHFLPHGWSKGVMSTRRLEAANAQMKKAISQGVDPDVARQQALEKMARYPKDVQAVEAAAAHGASILSLSRQGEQGAYKEFLSKGAYFPQGLEGSRSNARVLIPGQFGEDVWGGTGPLSIDLSQAADVLGVAQPFGGNREVWNAYMHKQLPGIKPDELDTLATMSTDMLYHAYVNAAHPISGGVRGAERIFRATRDGELQPDLMKGRGGKLADTARKISAEKQGEIGGMIPNLTELMGIYHEGMGITSGMGKAKDYFPQAVKEITRIVGRGNYEDAQILIHALALTSTASDVRRNAELALRVLAEWKFGTDTTLRSQFGLSGANFDEIMKGGFLREDFRPQQQRSLTKAFNEFAKLREGQAITSTVQGGPKTHSYAGSFLAPVWRKAIDLAAGGTELGRDAKRAFNEALSVFAWDRHHNRIDQGATGVNAIEAFLNRERGIIAAKASGLSPEEAQSAGWLWVRNRQGLISEIKGDGDTAQALQAAIQKTWDHDANAGESWNALINHLTETQGFTPDEALDQAYDLTRQYVFYSLLKRSLDKPEVQAALRKAGYTPSLTSLKDDALGFLQRGAHGLAPDEWPQPLGNVQGPGGLVEKASSLPPGQVLRFTGSQWEPHPSGFGVPIAMGKAFAVGQQQTLRKSLEGLLNRGVVSDLFDPSSGVDNSARLGIGLVQDGNELRPAIFALTDDQARAAAGAARTDAKRVISLDTGESLPIPGTTRNRHLPGLLDDIAGPSTPLPRPTLDEARRRGVTMMEMDTTNFHSILQRKIVNPLMDALAQVSLKDGTEQATKQNLGDIHAPDFPEKAVRSASNFDYALSSNDQAVAMQTLKDGRTYKDFFNRVRMDAERDIAYVKSTGVTWKPYTTLEDRLKLAEGNAKLTKTIKDWHKQGIDIGWVRDPDEAGIEALLAQKAADAGEQVSRQSNASLFKAAWGETALLSLKYLTGNLQGNWIQNALAGVFMAPSWKEYAAAYKIAEGGLEETTRRQAMASLKGTQIFNKWGDAEMPAEAFRGGVRGVTSNYARASPSAVGELVGRVTRNEALGRRAGTPFIINNNLSQAIDTVGRASILGQAHDDGMRAAIGAWESEVRRVGQNIPGFEFSVQDGINVPDGGLFPEPLKRQFESMGLKEGDAEHLVRTYVNSKAKSKANAIKEMNRVQFSYDRTNLDEWVAKFVPFHYWYSRALRYYGEEAIRHPFLALNYMRAQDGIEDAQNDPGLSARQKGFLRLMGTPLGFTLLMNPDALFGVVKVFNMDDAYEADGQTSLGGAIQWMKNFGFGLYPWIDGTLNLMGLYGNTFEPDLLGIRHKALVGAAANWVGAHTGFRPGSPYADAMGQLRYATSSFISSFTPDWVSQPVAPREGGSSQEASLDTIIESLILQNNPQMTNGELLAIMTEQGAEYQRAYQQAADAGIVQQLLNFTLPENFRMRGDKKDQLAAQRNTIYEAATAAGVSPYDFAPTPGDLTFKARYKALTGKEWQPGDYESADTQYDLIRAPQEAKPFIVASAEYQNLGTPKQQRKFDVYWGLRNGTDARTAGLPEDARKEIALEWADAHHAQAGINQMYDLRDAFEATHPEFGEFKQWQDRVRNLANQYGGTLAEYRRRASQQNPNAARYFADSEAFVKRTYPQDQWPAELDKATVSAAAFHAITGKGTNRQNPGPIPGVPPVDLTLPSMEPPAPPQQSGPRPENWATQLAYYGRSQGIAPIGYS